MSKAYKKIEVVGVSSESVSAAIDAAIAKAKESVRGLAWFEVDEVRGKITDGAVAEYQVTVRVGFRLD